MNSYMLIQVRVLSAKAQAQMKALQAQTAGLEAASARAASVSPVSARSSASLVKWGNQLQWTGRQIQYNFTLPLALAAGAAAKWELDNQKAFTHVAKVYGDTQAAAEQFRKENKNLTQQMAEQKATTVFRQELNALGDAFEAISNHYGVAQKGVLEVAGAWAAAGASGKALAESVNLTMQAVIIGDMDAAKATDALISIQAQYNLSSGQLADTLAYLNAVENQTGVDMKGLIDGFQRAAGVARTAGVGVRQLAALVAALTPAAGSAANAGNALKTIFSRLMSPTKGASQVMEAMNLNIKGTAWQSATAVERLKMMQGAFTKLSSAQQVAVSSTVASRWQINKFTILMNELGPQMSYYEKALEATSSRGKAFAQMQKELNTVLESNPQRLKQIWVILQNAMADVIQPMIPYIVYLANSIKNLVVSFSNLDPSLQKIILLGLAMLAVIGPIMRYIGSITTLFGSLGKATKFVAGHLGLLGATFKNSEGKVISAQFHIISFLKSLTVRPILFFASAAMTAFGAMAGYIQTAMAMAMNGVAKVLIAAAPIIAGSINGIFRAVQMSTFVNLIVSSFTGLAAALLGPLTAVAGTIAGAFGEIRIFQYVWATNMVASFRAMVFRIGTVLTLLPTFAMEAMASLWTILTVPGAFSTAVVAGWVRLRGMIAVVWSSLYGVLAGITAAGQRLIAATTLRGGVGIVAAWTAVRAMIARGWAATLAFLVSPTRIMGAFAAIGRVLAAVAPWLIRLVTGPWGLAIAAVTGLLYAFRKQVAQIWNNIVAYFRGNADLTGFFGNMINSVIGMFNRLPQGVQNAMIAVVQVVRDAALAVYSWFSYINPFAHHSPSLVENVTKGIGEVNKQFAGLGGIKKHTTAAYSEIKRFGSLTAKLGLSAAKVQQAQDRKTIGGVSKAALGSYDKLTGILNRLTPIMSRLKGQMQAQQAVVDGWQAKLEKAQAVLGKLQDKLQAAQSSLSDYASAPLKGMQAMDNQIFNNTMAQNKLNYAMMKMQDTYGTLDAIKSKMEAINGAQELLRGEKNDLRSAGAGSDILGSYDSQIKALEKNKTGLATNMDAMQQMQNRLDALQHKAEELNLVKSLKFDELTHQIELAANTTKELSFDQVMAGIKSARDQIDKYAPAVDKAQKSVDGLQAAYDRENAKLTAITNKYNSVNNAIQAINDSIGDVVGSAQKMHDALKKSSGLDAKSAAHKAALKKPKKPPKPPKPYVSPDLQNFRDAAAGNFPDPGGAGLGLRKNWKSQVPGIKDFTKNLSKQTADMFGSLNPFAPLMKKWDQAKSWLVSHVKSGGTAIGDAFSSIFKGVGNPFTSLQKPATQVFKKVAGIMRSVGKGIKAAWELLAPDIKKFLKNLWLGIQDLWKQVAPELAKFADLIKPLGKALYNLWVIAKPILAILGVAFLSLAKIIMSVLASTIRPVFNAIGTILKGFVRIVRGVLEIIIGLFTLDFKMALKGLSDMFTGTFTMIWGILRGAVQIIWGIISGMVRGIVNFFKWLYDVLVGHSIIPDLVKAIIRVFKTLGKIGKWIWDHVCKPIVDFFKEAWKKIQAGLKAWWNGIKAAWNALPKLGKWTWDHVLKPVFDWFVDLWKRKVKPALAAWWNGIKTEWAVLKKVGRWVWDNVLVKTFTFYKSLWSDKVKPELAKWFGRVKDVWYGLTGLGNWVKTNVMDKIVSKIKAGWTAIRDWLKNNTGMLTGPVSGIVNTVIRAVNKLISGLNKISDVLPGINFHINLIPQLAKGGEMPGRRVGGGFKTNGARAIVGEGKANHPEYVIPTDPTYRKRALTLHAQAGRKLGLSMNAAATGAWGEARDKGKFLFADGGILGHITSGWDSVQNMAKGAAGWIKGNIHKLASAPFAVFKTAAKRILDKVGWSVAKGLGMYGVNKIGQWVGATDKELATKASEVKKQKAINTGGGKWNGNYSKDERIARAQKFAQAQVGKPYIWGGVGPGGYDCSGFMSAITNVIRGKMPYSRVGATATFPWAGFGPGVGAFTIGSTNSYAGGVGHMAGTLGGMKVESYGGHGPAIGHRGYNDPGFTTHAHLMGLAKGGIVRRTQGGVAARLGEGRYDEAVTPLPPGWRADTIGGGKRTEIHFHGATLEFPNIKSGDDAQEFLDNLEILAKD